ncbi:hypothetical protein [Carboxylicivirga sp. N1Y90]|uniref:hypothetical protein n=1 Tax=Carboxylicivirga fragile TaxID=3417571 RepID=UPI003D335FA7|nr:hypothetical protein [Marinilabiliaceae bacterium N1Y90]
MNKIKDVETFNQAVVELSKIYQEWLDIFPFELEMFEHLKGEFSKELPIVKQSKWTLNDKVNEIEIDIYSNKTFHQFLAQKTTAILSQINTLTLHEEGKINDIQKHRIDVINRKRRHKLNSQVMRSRYQKPEYLDYISEWFEDEKEYIEEIKLYLEENKDTNRVKKISAKWYALLHIFKINAGLEATFPLNDNDQFDYKLIKKFAEDNYPLKNGQGFYRAFKEFYSEQEDAIKKSFGKGYKQTLIEMTNAPLLIAYIEKPHQL